MPTLTRSISAFRVPTSSSSSALQSSSSARRPRSALAGSTTAASSPAVRGSGSSSTSAAAGKRVPSAAAPPPPLDVTQQVDHDRKRRREVKAQLARKEAIRQLHEKRAVKQLPQHASETDIEQSKEADVEVTVQESVQHEEKEVAQQDADREEEVYPVALAVEQPAFFGEDDIAEPQPQQSAEPDVAQTAEQSDVEPVDSLQDRLEQLISSVQAEEEQVDPQDDKEETPPVSARADVEDHTDQRIDRILGYLRSVDSESHLAPVDTTTPAPSATTTPAAASIAVFDSVKAKMMGQQMELEEKSRTVSLLRAELKKVRELHKEQSNQFKKELKAKLALQRKEYEAMIKRHLGFIDKVLAEKDDITKKCETMADTVKQLEKQYKDKISTMDEIHQRELKQQRSLWESSEKIKREKWMQERSKAIKEQTVKGLEPEIQKMIAQHKAQVAALESKQREDIRAERESLMDQHQRQMEHFRDKLVSERQKACEEEREFARQRYQKQLEREEMEFQQQRRKLLADFQEQKDALAAAAREERRQDELAHRKVLEELRAEIEAEKEGRAQALDEARRRHMHEMSQQRERLVIEKEEWQAQYTARVETDIRQKERVFKETLLRERDAELETIISRLESESSMSHSDIAKRHRGEIEQLKADHADEVKQLRQQCSAALDKVIEMNRRIESGECSRRDVEKDVWRLQNEVDVKQQTIDEMKVELRRLREGEDALKDEIRKSFNEQLTHKDTIVQSLHNQLSKHQKELDGIRAKCNQELEAVQKDKENALQMIESKVRHTVSGKDDTINTLRTQLEELRIKNAHLELLIEKQRKELLS
ncbi:hypothetical protein RI367_004358 [Sorochytrium milnesiophthora]